MRVKHLVIICIHSEDELQGRIEDVTPSAQALQQKYGGRVPNGTVHLCNLKATETPNGSAQDAWLANLRAGHAAALQAIANFPPEETVGIYISGHGTSFPDAAQFQVGDETPGKLARLVAGFGFKRIDKISIVACRLTTDVVDLFCQKLHKHTQLMPIVASYSVYVTVLHANKVIHHHKRGQQTIQQLKADGSGLEVLSPEQRAVGTGKKIINPNRAVEGSPVSGKTLKETYALISSLAGADQGFANRLRGAFKIIRRFNGQACQQVSIEDWARGGEPRPQGL